MSKLDTLETKYREAHDAFKKSGSEKNHDAYEKAKKAFADARVEQRQAEEADPNHPRGTGLASVTDEEN